MALRDLGRGITDLVRPDGGRILEDTISNMVSHLWMDDFEPYSRSVLTALKIEFFFAFSFIEPSHPMSKKNSKKRKTMM